MIRLEQINLSVADMANTLDFYQAAFPQWQVRAKGKSNWYGIERNWLHFGDDYNYLTFNDAGNGNNRDLKSVQLGLAHFAFEVSNLNRLIDRMSAAGYQASSLGADNSFRNNIYFIDPNGFEVEFVEYLSDIPVERNNEN